MAEYRSQNGAAIPSSSGPANATARGAHGVISNALSVSQSADKHSVTAGKLMEVELADRAKEEEPKAVRQPRVRLGRDGKPWRGRKRRNSENLARDALVESILKDTPRMFSLYIYAPLAY